MRSAHFGVFPQPRIISVLDDFVRDAPGFRYENIETPDGVIIRYAVERHPVAANDPPLADADPFGVMANAARAVAVYAAMAQERVNRGRPGVAARPTPVKPTSTAIPEFDEPPMSRCRRMATIEVEDPDPDTRRVVKDEETGALKLVTRKVRARANIAHDVLRMEFEAGRISEQAFDIGRIIEGVLSRGRPSGGGQWLQGDRVDAASAHEHAIASGIDAANEALAMRYEIRRAVGWRMATAVCLVLGDGLDLTEMAHKMGGKDGRRNRKYYAQLFRDGLRDFVDEPKRV